jgi:hypothetical protein
MVHTLLTILKMRYQNVWKVRCPLRFTPHITNNGQWIHKLCWRHTIYPYQKSKLYNKQGNKMLASLLLQTDNLPVGSLLMTDIWCGSTVLGPWSLPPTCCCCNPINRYISTWTICIMTLWVNNHKNIKALLFSTFVRCTMYCWQTKFFCIFKILQDCM